MHKIEVFFPETENDSESFSVKNDVVSDLGIEVNSVKIVYCYYINADLSLEELENTAKNLFSDPIVQEFTVDSDAVIKADWLIEVKFNSGVTDNTGEAAVIGLEDLIKRKLNENEGINTTKKYFLSGNLSENQVKRIAKELLANEVIESFELKKLNSG